MKVGRKPSLGSASSAVSIIKEPDDAGTGRRRHTVRRSTRGSTRRELMVHDVMEKEGEEGGGEETGGRRGEGG